MEEAKRQKLETEGQAQAPPHQQGAEATPSPAPEDAGPACSFSVVYGKAKEDVSVPEGTTVGKLKEDIAQRTGIAANTQKLVLRGMPLKDDSASLKQAGVKTGAKLMLIGTPAPVVEATRSTPPAAESAVSSNWDTEAQPSEPWSKQKPHERILAKGKPEDAMPGISGKQVPLPDEVREVRGLCNSTGTKVRAVFKPEIEELTISSSSAQQRVPYASVKKIEVQPIEGQEGYSIVSIVLGSGRLWLYWWPSQHTASLKIRILGVASLLE